MPASAQHPVPGDGFPGGPAHRTSPLATTTAPSTGTQDLDEIFSLCDRVAVIAGGRLSPARPVGEVTLEEIGLLMGGRRGGDHARPA